MSTKSRERAAGSGPLETAEPRLLRYQHVYDLVLDLIDERDLREGDKLPSTAELAKLADVSIISVRRALDELGARRARSFDTREWAPLSPRSGLVSEPARRRGRFSARSPAADRGAALENRTAGSPWSDCPARTTRRRLGIDAGQPVWKITRLRNSESAPKILRLRAVLPLSRVTAIDEDYLAGGGSLYGFLHDRYGLVDDFVEQSLEVDHPNAWERSTSVSLAQGQRVRSVVLF